MRRVRRVQRSVAQETRRVTRAVPEVGDVRPVFLRRVEVHLTPHHGALRHALVCIQKIVRLGQKKGTLVSVRHRWERTKDTREGFSDPLVFVQTPKVNVLQGNWTSNVHQIFK